MPSLAALLFASATAFSILSGAAASALPLAPRDVFVPPVTYPHAGTVWQMGARHNVTWSTAGAPVNITNSVGMIVLAQNGETFVDGAGGLNHPIAQGFNIRTGRIEITVPYVPPANNYQLVLFGDSGNYSPKFTIEAAC